MNSKLRIIADIAIVFLALIFIFYWLAFPPPEDFPSQSFIKVEEGFSVLQIGEKLKEDNVIRSRTVFALLARIMGLEKEIKSGEYFFDKPVSVVEIIKRLGAGDFGIRQLKVTIPEGSSLKDIVRIFNDFKNFKEDEFYLIAKDPSLEGYLFPDTYFVLPNIDALGFVKIMKANFEKKISGLGQEIQDSGYGLNEIITMASLIEKEVFENEDKKIVSGILWKRMKIGMPLQVDAAYDTYLYKGLPSAPICNPGLESIEAALRPVESPYLYYLSDKEGITHFAKTFEEHKLNKIKYLR